MRKFIKPVAIFTIALATTGGVAMAMNPKPTSEKPVAVVQQAEVAEVEKAPEKKIDSTETTPKENLEVVEKEPVSEEPEQPVVVKKENNEDIIWDFLINNGFQRHQAAGIMGNLKQEHNFNTSDEPSGLGIAQWIDGRRANLIAKGNYLDINVQLEFLMHELKTTERISYAKLLQASTVDQAVRVFQNYYERCHATYCNELTRLQYAREILDRH